MASLIVFGPFSYTPGAILLLLISPFRKILIFAGCGSKSQCLASFLNLWMYAVSISESFCWISMNLELYVCILALFRWLQSCSLMWGQGLSSCSVMRSRASPLAFPFATITSFSSTRVAAFSISASQPSSLCPCLPLSVRCHLKLICLADVFCCWCLVWYSLNCYCFGLMCWTGPLFLPLALWCHWTCSMHPSVLGPAHLEGV